MATSQRSPIRRSKRPTPRQSIGRRGEQLALEALRARGYQIEATNVRYPVGEIDIVARDGRTLCFVEVRSASSMEYGGALASITGRKRQRLIRAARWYLQAAPTAQDIRFDAVAIQWPAEGHPQVEILQHAFVVDSVPW
ncbi:MAG: YraN family protein [Candidatus Omnitrophica bacterium CG11_big_fil_rev_8_21_14_0_20_63_9]|nr:MAG: YraN family protein [Candidatus Omnitrophica bacterium CG11_big_fil_rev_8_21_14_0_20_63_9]